MRKAAHGRTIVGMTQQPYSIPEFTLADRLRKAREVAHLDQGPFADLIGVSRGTVSNYERGLTERYKVIVLRAWAEATGVPLEWIETGRLVAVPDPQPPARESEPTPQTSALFITPDRQAALAAAAAEKSGRSIPVSNGPSNGRYFPAA